MVPVENIEIYYALTILGSYLEVFRGYGNNLENSDEIKENLEAIR